MKNIEILKGKSQRFIGIIYLTFSVVMIITIPRFDVIYKEMLEGEKLPLLAAFLINSNPYLWGICGYFPGLILILSDRKELNDPTLKICAVFFLIILIGFTVVGLFMPLLGPVHTLR